MVDQRCRRTQVRGEVARSNESVNGSDPEIGAGGAGVSADAFSAMRGVPERERNCQDLWIGVLRDLLISCLVVGSFDEFALLEPGSCSDQGDQVWRVDRPPAGLG